MLIGAFIFVGIPFLMGFIPIMFAQFGPLGFIFGCILGFALLVKIASYL